MTEPLQKKLKTDKDEEQEDAELRELKQRAQDLSIDLAALPLANTPRDCAVLYLQALIQQKEELIQQKEEFNQQKQRNENLLKYTLRQAISKPREMELYLEGMPDSNTGKSKHNAAVRSPTPLDLSLEVINVDQIPENTPSGLLGKFVRAPDEVGEPLRMPYATEADVSSFIMAALEDAVTLATLATKRTLRIRHEYSLFKDRPDHLVVMDAASHDPVLALEDKKPFNGDVSAIVEGQVFDYMMEMRVLGLQSPYVILSSFERSWLYCGGEEGERGAAEQQDSRLDGLLDQFSCQETMQHQNLTQSPPKLVPESNLEEKYNFAKKGVADPSTDNCWVQASEESVFTPLPKREVVRSQDFKSSELICLLYTALLCSLSQNPSSPKKEMTDHAASLNKRFTALMVNQSKYWWGKLHWTRSGIQVKVKDDVRSSKRRTAYKTYDQSAFFAFRILGRGETSKVFQAFDSMGCQVVIKMYLKTWSGDESESDKKLNTKQVKEKAKKQGEDACKREMENLRAMYDMTEKEVYCIELMGFPCVIMPLFLPLKAVERRHKLDDIENCLLKLHERKLKYLDCDLRWRHIGKWNDKIIMFDLADLESEENQNKEVVKTYLKKLEDRLHMEPGPG